MPTLRETGLYEKQYNLGYRVRRRICLGPASFLPIREGCTEPAFSVAGCICASSWFPPLLSWSSLGAHPVAGYAWRPPGVGERADGWVDGKGEGVGCFVRVYLFRNRPQAYSRTSTKLCKLTYLHAHTYTHLETHICTHIYMHVCTYIDRQLHVNIRTYMHANTCMYAHRYT